MTRLRDQRGQALVLTIVFITGLLGMAALVLDVGHWYRSQRHLQAVADSAALAAAQELPGNTGTATDVAKQYAKDNDGPVPTTTYTTALTPDDTVRVDVQRDEEGIFSKVFAIANVNVSAHATARAAAPKAARWVAPIVVNSHHPMLACDPAPCSGEATIDLVDLHKPGAGDAAGSFALLDLRADGGGTAGEDALAEWMLQGFDGYMWPGTYDSAPSANFNSSQFLDALAAHTNNGDVVLFPVYEPPIVKGGSTAEFNVIGWVGYTIESVGGEGASRTLTGQFVSYTTEGIQALPGDVTHSFGVKTIQLID